MKLISVLYNPNIQNIREIINIINIIKYLIFGGIFFIPLLTFEKNPFAIPLIINKKLSLYKYFRDKLELFSFSLKYSSIKFFPYSLSSLLSSKI